MKSNFDVKMKALMGSELWNGKIKIDRVTFHSFKLLNFWHHQYWGKAFIIAIHCYIFVKLYLLYI